MAGITGVLLVFATITAGFSPDLEIWLASGLVVSLILHARAGFALSRAQREIELLRGLITQIQPSALAVSIAPSANPAIGDQSSDVVALSSVREAIEESRIDLYLQPIVSLPQRKQRFFEAYSRLKDENGAVIEPGQYLDAAERASRVGVIDNMILMRSIQALRGLGAESDDFRMFCNISPATLFDDEFFTKFTDYLDADENLARRLVFEFTYPSIEMMHPRVEANLQAIADRGFLFSVDHLHRFNLNWRSLSDRSFRFVKASGALLLNEAAKGPEGHARLKAFKTALSDHGIDLIVEKIEFEAQLEKILEFHVDYGQGSLFGAPKPADAYLRQDAPFAVAS